MKTCVLCEKKSNSARKHAYRSSFVTKRTLRTQKPNLQKIKILENGNSKKVTVCTRCLKLSKLQRA